MISRENSQQLDQKELQPRGGLRARGNTGRVCALVLTLITGEKSPAIGQEETSIFVRSEPSTMLAQTVATGGLLRRNIGGGEQKQKKVGPLRRLFGKKENPTITPPAEQPERYHSYSARTRSPAGPVASTENVDQRMYAEILPGAGIPQGKDKLPYVSNGSGQKGEHRVGDIPGLTEYFESMRGENAPNDFHIQNDSLTATFLPKHQAPERVQEALERKDIVLTCGSGHHVGFVKVPGSTGYMAFIYGAGTRGFGKGEYRTPPKGEVGDVRIFPHGYNAFTGENGTAHKYGHFVILPCDEGTDGADMTTILARIIGEICFHGSTAHIDGFFSHGCFRLRIGDIVLMYKLGILHEGATFTTLEVRAENDGTWTVLSEGGVERKQVR